MKNNKKLIFAGIFLISLFLIFFVGRGTDSATGKRHLIITSNGVNLFRKGLDVSGGTRLVFKISYDKYEKIYTNAAELNAVKKTIEDIILKNIDKRISKLGVSDYKAYVQRLDTQNYIVVEIGGIADLEQAKEIIGKTVELEFKLQNEKPVTASTIAGRKQIAKNIFQEVSAKPDLMAKLVDGRASENIFFNIYSGTLSQLPDIYKNNITKIEKYKDKLYPELLEGKYTRLESTDQLGNVTGIDLNGFVITRLLANGETTVSGKVEKTYTIADIFIQDREARIQAVDSEGNALNGAYFKFANTSTSQVGEPVVAINFDDKGKEIFCRLSEANIGKPMAIFIGGQLLTSPTIQSKICGGSAQIDGSFTSDSARELSTSLNDGAMPAPLVLMQEEKINPSLGTNALTGAMIAAIVGFFAIAALIFFMYGFKKMILTSIVLIVFLTILGGLMKLSDFALSLSGIAAIILSIGMGVDANILIYERLREERKEGKSWENAIDIAKERSRTAIRDGQLSTGLIALLLFFMGTNIFKGFGAMMLTTMLLTLFVNVPITKILLHMFYKNQQDKAH